MLVFENKNRKIMLYYALYIIHKEAFTIIYL